MKIKFELEDSELALLIDILEQNTTTLEVNTPALALLSKLQIASDLNKRAFEKVKTMLADYVDTSTSPIEIESDLRNQLGLDDSWLKELLYEKCNLIVAELLREDGNTFSPTKIKRTDAAKCKTVQDIIVLIKKSYESAK